MYTRILLLVTIYFTSLFPTIILAQSYSGGQSPARLTIRLLGYHDSRRPGDTISFDIAERGGGIKFYRVLIYPEIIIESNKGTLTQINPLTGKPGGITIGLSEGHRLTGLDSENLRKAMDALGRGKHVWFAIGRPIVITLNVPPGMYYFDYSFTTRVETRTSIGGRTFAPLEYLPGREDNWGPYKIRLSPGEEKEVIVRMNGTNITNGYAGLNGFLSFLIFGDRRAYLQR